jgi:biopolymer transport protein ExbB/TolQ
MSATIEFTCPHCSNTIRTNARYAGMQGPCPHCGKTVKVEAAAGAEFQPLQTSGSSKPATIDVNPIVAGLFGCALTVMLYAIFLVIRGTYLGQLFTNRGMVPYVSTLVFSWGVSILVLRYLAVKRQLKYAEMELELLPLQTGVQITPKNVESFLQHLEGLPAKSKDSILGRRIRGALEHFRSRNSVPEVQAYLASHAQIDASSIDSGYTLMRSIIWATPILGFIGTVLGISSAVNALARSLDSPDAPAAVTASADPVASATSPPAASSQPENMGAQMIAAMGLVTQGLAVAFDTTFVALVMAILLLFPSEELKRIEYGMLDRIEAFTNESLVRRMSDDTSHTLTPEVAKILEPTFRKHQQWLLEWQAKVGELGNTIGKEFERHASGAQQKLESLQAGKLSETVQAVQALATVLPEMNQAIDQFRTASMAVAGEMQSSLAKAAELQRELAQNSASMGSHIEQLRSFVPPAVGENVGRLEQAAESLSNSIQQLSQLASQSATVPLVQGDGARHRGGLMGLFRS